MNGFYGIYCYPILNVEISQQFQLTDDVNTKLLKISEFRSQTQALQEIETPISPRYNRRHNVLIGQCLNELILYNLDLLSMRMQKFLVLPVCNPSCVVNLGTDRLLVSSQHHLTLFDKKTFSPIHQFVGGQFIIKHVIVLNVGKKDPLVIPVQDTLSKASVWRILSNNHQYAGKITPSKHLTRLQKVADWFNPVDESVGMLMSGVSKSDQMIFYKLCLE